jgi:hypothetical protein
MDRLLEYAATPEKDIAIRLSIADMVEEAAVIGSVASG